MDPLFNFINGAFVGPVAGKTLTVVNPATEEPLATDCPASTAEDVNAAVAAASAALPAWKAKSGGYGGAAPWRLRCVSHAAQIPFVMIELRLLPVVALLARGCVVGGVVRSNVDSPNSRRARSVSGPSRGCARCREAVLRVEIVWKPGWMLVCGSGLVLRQTVWLSAVYTWSICARGVLSCVTFGMAAASARSCFVRSLERRVVQRSSLVGESRRR